MAHSRRLSCTNKRYPPRNSAGGPPPIADNIVWDREIQPRERYRIEYIDRDDQVSVREIELHRLGHMDQLQYLGVLDTGRFKTMRLDRIHAVEQLSFGHDPSIRPSPTYQTMLPAFPLADAVHRMPTLKGSRTWLVNLNDYTCACPERRIRVGMGYVPGQLGHVCPHLARAILDFLPPALHGSSAWPSELLSFLADPKRMHIDNLA